MSTAAVTSSKNIPAIEWLAQGVGTLLKQAVPPDTSMTQVANTLQSFGKTGLSTIMYQLLDMPGALQDVATKSYLHGNGFYKIVLFESADFTIRTNIWMPGTQPQENLHDHRWHLSSAIIAGSLTSEIWEESASRQSQEYEEYIYIGKTTQKAAHVIPVGRTRVVLKETITHTSGECYFLPSNIMHRIVLSGEALAATLMCHPVTARKWGRVITINKVEPDVERNHLSADHLAYLLRQYLALVDDNYAHTVDPAL